jgi:hypothetical protein
MSIFLSLGRLSKESGPSPRLLVPFRSKHISLRRGVVSLTPNLQAGVLFPVGCSQVLIPYIRSYPPYLEVVSSIRNVGMGLVVMTMHPRKVVINNGRNLKYFTCLME